MKRWHVVHTKPRLETQAIENLERQGYTCFLPMLNIQKISRGKFRTATVPLFPRYAFIQLEHHTNDTQLYSQNWAPIRSTVGVQGLVRFGQTLATLDDALVSALQAHILQNTAPKPLLQPQQEVTITNGAFAGVAGIYQRLTQLPDGESRAFVLIELLSKSVTISIAPEHLKGVL
jgi:transcriptional antiterminator RfaH